MLLGETVRVRIRHFDLDDAAFVVQLLNQRSFIDNIGDKGVRNRQQAEDYLLKGPLASYRKFGFGLYLIALKADDTPIGMCGLVKRDNLEHVDLGYALLPEYTGQGLAKECAEFVLQHGKNQFNLAQIAAAANPDNLRSIRLLDSLGFQYIRPVTLFVDQPELSLYLIDL